MLDDDCLSANHVGRPVQQQRSSHASGQRAIDRLILIIESIFHHHVRRNRTGRLVHIIVKRDVRMRIHDPRRDVLAAGINHGRARWRIHALTDSRNPAILDVNRPILDVAVCHRHDDSILDHNVVVRCTCGCLRKRAETRKHEQHSDRDHAKNKFVDRFHAINSKRNQ